ncbi:nuclear pore complex component-domain-containing protein [Dipodascopsis uninucleata]
MASTSPIQTRWPPGQVSTPEAATPSKNRSSTPYSQSPFKTLYTPSPSSSNLANISSPLSPTVKREDVLTSPESRLISELPTGSLPSTPKDVPRGEWRHPAFDVLHTRVSKAEFTQATSRKMFLNAASWLAYSIAVHWLRKWNWIQELSTANEKFSKNMTYIGIILQLLFLWNILDGIMRLLKPRDKLEDIPLTPNQRKLMGLDVNVKSNSAGRPVTPPKYVKTYNTHPRDSPRVSPLLKKSIQESMNNRLSPRTPGGASGTTQKQNSSASQQSPTPHQLSRSLPSTPATSPSTSITTNGRYLYMLDSPGRGSPSRRA